jgi:NTP pyrophosphatase (non-canonical NTP hydrolase)
MNFEQLESAVIKWADDRGLSTTGDANKQLLKTFEELGETARAELKNDQQGIKDGVGDAIVTLIIYTHKKGTTINECLEIAYNEIKDRTGKLTDGVFVKD